MRLSHENKNTCKFLKNNAADICCAVLKVETITDLGEVHNLYTWEVADASQGDLCYITSITGKIHELSVGGALESLLRHVSQGVWSKPVIGELEWLLDSAKPFVVGPDPDQDGRSLLAVRIERYDFDDVVVDDVAVLDEVIEQWFGKVSVDTRLVDTHLKNADMLEWWFKHSPSTKSLKKNAYQEAFDVNDSKA